MLGVIVNTAAIIVCTLLGLLLKKVLKERVINVVMQALGIAVLCVGLMDVIKTENALVFVCSLAFGTLIGALCHIQDGVEKFGDFLEKKIIKDTGGKVGQAFVTSSLIFCVGAMVIYGSIQSGLHQPTTLYIKSLLDGVLALMLATTLGWGVMLSAIPVFIIQGAIALCAGLIEPYATTAFMNELSGIGGAIVMCIGINLLGIKKINTADMIPAILGSLVMFLL